MAEVLPFLMADPQIPISTGGLESILRNRVDPVLAPRQSQLANIERTNSLLDLVVADAHGAFDDLNAAAEVLRADANRHGGWTVALRSVPDPRPRTGTYSSLRDAALLASVAEERGVA